MKAWLLVLVCFFLAPWYAPAQTREETIGFIVSEYRSFESREYKYKEITFSPAGDTFTIRRAAQGDKDYVVTFNLKDVEVYKVTINHANGINQHQLMVRNRGSETSIGRDGSTFKGAVKITPTIDNENKILALERAFTQLTLLTTGRKPLFR